ncbi:glutathione S-transferase family protein [Candidatus Puniceispirillum marinum]|uniref:Glutathione S-transferase domain protein n=1 Tax=Puniceispirillum marinum (strain IMCC1322) TaxID=488538 RepID=D5BQH2_PUNMI|nr:glutathione S-transferase N-terminal domain-containing protein [Candidatus Puniceispirillum marinum]ADE40690.1 Glutathione S-transferase domain protein [Candidatus Puniceispirillum marinum IMCC1322]
MQLFYTTASPYVRKVMLSAHVLGFADDLTLETVDWASPDGIAKLALNPLAKVPALIADGKLIADSRVIMEYFDLRAGGGKIIPNDPETRIDVLSQAALIEGMIDASILIVYETRLRPENMVMDSIMQRYRDKIIRGLGMVGAATTSYDNGALPTVADIALAALLDYLDFRNIVAWRDHAPHLADWMAGFAAAVPGYQDTMPKA